MKFKKILATGIAAVMILGTTVVGFADMGNGQWDSNSIYPKDVVNTQYFTPVKFLVDKKVVHGDENGLFNPSKNISRAEFAKMMAVMTNNTGQMSVLQKENYFADVPADHWARGYINCIKNSGLMQGTGNGKFTPTREVSYVEVIATMIRSRNVSAVTTGTWPNNYITYAKQYLSPIVGDRNITDWTAPATKGDVAMMMYRYYKKADPAPTTTGGGITSGGGVGI